ncbi:MAG: hypothetical protein M1825_000990 [Sarcosagium campestre]|nr:MAG: hypothetical protein M1825_000990 [Sarcosagium campestre]
MSKETTKRKRPSEEEEGRKHKRPAVGQPAGASSRALKVSHIRVEDLSRPVIATTPGFSLRSGTKFLPSFKPVPKIRGTSKTKELSIKSQDHPTLEYKGREAEEGSAENLQKHYIGIFDPSTAELQLIAARRVIVKPTPKSDREEVEKEKPILTANEIKSELGRAFGTKKIKKAILSQTENLIAPDKATRDQNGESSTAADDPAAAAILQAMHSTVGSTLTREELEAASEAAKPRPIANLNANKAEEVYTAESLIGVQELKQLSVKEWHDAVKAKRGVETKSLFVGQRLQAIGMRDDILKLKVLRYYVLLLAFEQCTKGTGRQRKLPKRDILREKLGVSDFLVESIVRKFTDGGSITKWQIDRLYTDMAAVTLLIDGFLTDVHDFKIDTGLEMKETLQYYKEIGCHTRSPTEAEKTRAGFTKAQGSQRRMAQLRLPLEFPKPKRGRRG